MTDPGTLLHAILPTRVDERQARQATLPSAAGPIPLSKDLVSRFGDTAQLLHSEIGTQDDTADDDSGAFYRGRPICRGSSWTCTWMFHGASLTNCSDRSKMPLSSATPCEY